VAAPSLRIEGGEWRGRPLRSAPGRETRPTSGRARATLFDILGGVEGERVLDLYAGTGALGLEALSRGAASCTFVDSDRAALAAIRENVRRLGCQDRARVEPVSVERFLAKGHRGARHSLVLADPPYGAAGGVIPLLDAWDGLVEGARVVVEGSRRDPPDEERPAFTRERERRVGETRLVFYRWRPEDVGGGDSAPPERGESIPPYGGETIPPED
jgi:16S rRNA (guanine966-N2)-methyltransferase